MFQILKKVVGSRAPTRLKRIASYLSKSRVDFVIYDRGGRIIKVVESNGFTHKNGGRKKKDILKARVLKEIGIPLLVHGFCDHLEREFPS